MTERSRRAVSRDETHLQIGPSSLGWRGNMLEIDVNEVASPLPLRVAGHIRLTPTSTGGSFALDAGGRHTWHPIAPFARVEVKMRHPELSWSGQAYMDSNCGDEPLEHGFQSWTWSRARRINDAVVHYDTIARDGHESSLALRFDGHGFSAIEPALRHALPTTLWRVPRETRGDSVSLRQTLEDTPFYARSLVDVTLGGEACIQVHESVSLDRFRSNWVRMLLPFRMPRVFW